MRQYDILLVNGCSHTFGAETIADGDTHNPDNTNHSWAAHLGKLLGVKEVHNLAINGNSNDNIYHEIIHHTLNKIPPTANTLCVVQWTHWNRVIWIDPDNTDHHILLNPHEVTLPHVDNKLKESYVNHLSRDPKTVLTWLLNQHTLAGFFRRRNIDYCFYHIEPLPATAMPEKYFSDRDHLPNLIPFEAEWYMHMDRYSPRQTWGHYPELAHRRWAQDIITILTHRYQDFYA